jgi:hypothetical protein
MKFVEGKTAVGCRGISIFWITSILTPAHPVAFQNHSGHSNPGNHPIRVPGNARSRLARARDGTKKKTHFDEHKQTAIVEDTDLHT